MQQLGFQRHVDRPESLRVPLEGIVAHLLILIDRAQNRPDAPLVESKRLKIIKPEIAVAEPDIEVALGQTKRAKALHEQGDQFDFRLGARFAKDIRIELGKTTPAPFLHALIPVEFTETEPFDRTLQRIGPRSDQTADRRRHFRTQCDFAAAFIRKAEKLGFDLVARFGLVEVKRFQHRGIVFRETERIRGPTPELKQMIPAREVLGIEFAKTGKGLKRRHGNRNVAQQPGAGESFLQGTKKAGSSRPSRQHQAIKLRAFTIS